MLLSRECLLAFLSKERDVEEGTRGRDLNQLRHAELGAEEHKSSLQQYRKFFLSHLTSLEMGRCTGTILCLSGLFVPCHDLSR